MQVTVNLVSTILFKCLLCIGQASMANYSSDDEDMHRLAHGNQAEIGQFKSIVVLLFELDLNFGLGLESLCTGQIISEQWVLSAVHCFGFHLYYKSFFPYLVDRFKIQVVAGINDHKVNPPSRQERLAGSRDYFIYPGSLRTSGKLPIDIDSYMNEVVLELDIALLYINDPFEFNDKVGSVGLARNYVLDRIIEPSPCYSVGFGMTEEGRWTSTLNYVEVSAGGKEFCKTLKDDYMDRSRAFHICSKGKDKANICSGDSGGPLICGNGEQSVSVGVLSFYSLKSGAKSLFDSMECGESNRGVATYMFPGHAEKWISDTMGTPNFVAFLKKTDYSGAGGVYRWSIVFYLMETVLVRLILSIHKD